MNRKKIIALWLFLLIPLTMMAQKGNVSYIVSKVTGRVEVITPQGKQKVEKGDVLKADATINVSFSGSMTLLAENGNKQYVINSPGKAKLASFLADKRNTVLTLTEDYVKSVVAQLRKEKTAKVRRHSDPATVTRVPAIKDSLFVVEIVKDSTMSEKPDTTQCQN